MHIKSNNFNRKSAILQKTFQLFLFTFNIHKMIQQEISFPESQMNKPPIVRLQWPSFEAARVRIPGCCDTEPNFFDCTVVGGSICLPLSKFHDGIDDCADGSDEYCFPGQINCGSYCADPQHLIECLGSPVCMNTPNFMLLSAPINAPHSDSFCSMLSRKLCDSPNVVNCKGYGECVPRKWLMDGKKDCFDGSDEDPNYSSLIRAEQDSFSAPVNSLFQSATASIHSNTENKVVPPPTGDYGRKHPQANIFPPAVEWRPGAISRGQRPASLIPSDFEKMFTHPDNIFNPLLMTAKIGGKMTKFAPETTSRPSITTIESSVTTSKPSINTLMSFTRPEPSAPNAIGYSLFNRNHISTDSDSRNVHGWKDKTWQGRQMPLNIWNNLEKAEFDQNRYSSNDKHGKQTDFDKAEFYSTKSHIKSDLQQPNASGFEPKLFKGIEPSEPNNTKPLLPVGITSSSTESSMLKDHHAKNIWNVGSLQFGFKKPDFDKSKFAGEDQSETNIQQHKNTPHFSTIETKIPLTYGMGENDRLMTTTAPTPTPTAEDVWYPEAGELGDSHSTSQNTPASQYLSTTRASSSSKNKIDHWTDSKATSENIFSSSHSYLPITKAFTSEYEKNITTSENGFTTLSKNGPTKPSENGFTAPSENEFTTPSENGPTKPSENGFRMSSENGFTEKPENDFTTSSGNVFTTSSENSFRTSSENGFRTSSENGFTEKPENGFTTSSTEDIWYPDEDEVSPKNQSANGEWNKNLQTLAAGSLSTSFLLNQKASTIPDTGNLTNSVLEAPFNFTSAINEHSKDFAQTQTRIFSTSGVKESSEPTDSGPPFKDEILPIGIAGTSIFPTTLNEKAFDGRKSAGKDNFAHKIGEESSNSATEQHLTHIPEQIVSKSSKGKLIPGKNSIGSSTLSLVASTKITTTTMFSATPSGNLDYDECMEKLREKIDEQNALIKRNWHCACKAGQMLQENGLESTASCAPANISTVNIEVSKICGDGRMAYNLNEFVQASALMKMGSIFGAKVCVRGVKDRNSLVVDIECGGDCSLDEFQEKRHRMLENPDSEVDIEIVSKNVACERSEWNNCLLRAECVPLDLQYICICPPGMNSTQSDDDGRFCESFDGKCLKLLGLCLIDWILIMILLLMLICLLICFIMWLIRKCFRRYQIVEEESTNSTTSTLSGQKLEHEREFVIPKVKITPANKQHQRQVELVEEVNDMNRLTVPPVVPGGVSDVETEERTESDGDSPKNTIIEMNGDSSSFFRSTPKLITVVDQQPSIEDSKEISEAQAVKVIDEQPGIIEPEEATMWSEYKENRIINQLGVGSDDVRRGSSSSLESLLVKHKRKLLAAVKERDEKYGEHETPKQEQLRPDEIEIHQLAMDDDESSSSKKDSESNVFPMPGKMEILGRRDSRHESEQGSLQKEDGENRRESKESNRISEKGESRRMSKDSLPRESRKTSKESLPLSNASKEKISDLMKESKLPITISYNLDDHDYKKYKRTTIGPQKKGQRARKEDSNVDSRKFSLQPAECQFGEEKELNYGFDDFYGEVPDERTPMSPRQKFNFVKKTRKGEKHVGLSSRSESCSEPDFLREKSFEERMKAVEEKVHKDCITCRPRWDSSPRRKEVLIPGPSNSGLIEAAEERSKIHEETESRIHSGCITDRQRWDSSPRLETRKRISEPKSPSIKNDDYHP